LITKKEQVEVIEFDNGMSIIPNNRKKPLDEMIKELESRMKDNNVTTITIGVNNE